MRYPSNNLRSNRIYRAVPTRRLGLLAALSGLVVALYHVDLAAQADHRQVAGYIEETSHGLSGGYHISRPKDDGRESLPLGDYTPIYVDDHIVVSKVGHWVQFRHIDDGSQRIERANSPRRIDDLVSSTTPLGNLIAEYWAALDSWVRVFRAPDLNTAVNTTATTRGRPGGDLRSNLLNSSSDLRLVAGERSFALDWDGGKAPFELEIYPGTAAEPIGTWGDIKDREIDQTAITFAPGRYTIVLRDNDGTVVETDVMVVASNDLPSSPFEKPADAASSPVEALMLAAWLAAQSDSWTLEAYLQAKELAPVFPPAVVLADKLLKGQRILP